MLNKLTIEAPDPQRFPCLDLAQTCLRQGGLAPTILNAANEVAVQAFLGRRIGFLDIARVVEDTLSARTANSAGIPRDVDGILDADRQARDLADTICRRMAA
jgi:1-deoxy-D-xylulose-5-phosphate reductoisomerase